MIGILKKSRLLFSLIIFLNIPSLVASPMQTVSMITIENAHVKEGDVLKKLFNTDETLSYDALSLFLQELEDGVPDNTYSEEEWYKINRFLAFLSEQGVMPNASEEEQAELKKDIEELLSSDKDVNAAYSMDGYSIIPCVLYDQVKVVPCKSWLKKQCHHVAKFIKKHKTAVIIGAVLVVAAVVVVASVAIASSAAVASAAGAAASNDTESDEKEAKSSMDDKSQTSRETSAKITEPPLQQAFDKEITDYKNTILEKNIVIEPPKSSMDLSGGNERIIGAALAHESLNNFSQGLQSPREEFLLQGHGKIDQAFSTNQASFYLENNNEPILIKFLAT